MLQCYLLTTLTVFTFDGTKIQPFTHANERCTLCRSWALATSKYYHINTNQSQSQHMSQYSFKKTKETALWRPHEALQVYRDSIFGLIWLKSTYYWNHSSDQLTKNPPGISLHQLLDDEIMFHWKCNFLSVTSHEKPPKPVSPQPVSATLL